MNYLKTIFLTFQILAILILSPRIAWAQKSSIYIPRNIVPAYEKKTRSYDGKPGPNYWVNHSDYKIQAEVFPKERLIKGTEHIEFHNESPDSLKFLVLRLYLDINKKGNSRDEQVDPTDLTDGVRIDTIVLNGRRINVYNPSQVIRTSTNIAIRSADAPILPKSVASVDVKWSALVPRITRNRMGAYNDSTLYIAYWYPQIAVYDDIDRWDINDYGGDVEFYNDKNNFEYEITVPRNYLVWGTGLYQNLQEIVPPTIYSRFTAAHQSDSTVRIVTKDDLKNGVTISKATITWKFKAEGVPDVAFGLSSGYVWDGVSTVADSTGRRVFTDAVYPVNAPDWMADVAGYAKQSVEKLSTGLPGIGFPYPKITLFHAEQYDGSSMEAPMMCNEDIYRSIGSQVSVNLHEIAHSYFPFYMGTNERKNEWMDEGWATFFTSSLIGKLIKGADEMTGSIKVTGRVMGDEYDIPMIYPSIATRGRLLTFSSYAKSSTAYWVLQDILGEELFRKVLQEFMKRWNGKHPTPWDYFFTFNDVAKEDLGWFWKPWYFESGFPDLAVKAVKQRGHRVEITIEKVGNVPVPVDLNISYTDGSSENVHRTAACWKSGNRELVIELKSDKKIRRVSINTTKVPDGNEGNNVFELK